MYSSVAFDEISPYGRWNWRYATLWCDVMASAKKEILSRTLLHQNRRCSIVDISIYNHSINHSIIYVQLFYSNNLHNLFIHFTTIIRTLHLVSLFIIVLVNLQYENSSKCFDNELTTQRRVFVCFCLLFFYDISIARCKSVLIKYSWEYNELNRENSTDL